MFNWNDIPITASKIREATREDPVLLRVVHCVLHGWPVAIPEELKIDYSKQEEFTVEGGCLLRGTRGVILCMSFCFGAFELGIILSRFLSQAVPLSHFPFCFGEASYHTRNI